MLLSHRLLSFLLFCLFVLKPAKGQVLELNEALGNATLSQQNTVLEWLTSAPPPLSAAAETLLLGSWEALAYVDMTRPPALEEAVPDRYTFSTDSTFRIAFFQQNPAEPQLEATGNFVFKTPQLLFYLEDFPGRVFQEMHVWFVSEEYLVLEMDDLRLFFVHPK
jgi:hypothetical protein